MAIAFRCGVASTAKLRVLAALADQVFDVSYGEHFMSKKVVMFEYEKETKNSVRYKEVPDEGTAPVVGTLYVQKWFAGDSKSIEITIDKKD